MPPMPSFARTHPDRYTEHERQGFVVFPAVLLVAGYFFLGPLPLVLTAASILGWLAFYWAALNHRQNPIAMVVMWTIITFGAAVIVIYLPQLLWQTSWKAAFA
jgi:hypothetical protein